MSRTPNIRKSVVLVVSVAALVAPTGAIAYPVIGDDPASGQAVAEGHAWYAAYLKRVATRTKPANVKPNTLCPGKTICRKP